MWTPRRPAANGEHEAPRFSSSQQMQRAAQTERPFSIDGHFALASSGCLGLLRLEFLPVLLNKIQLLSMAVAGVEVELFHFSVCLIVVPVIVVEPVYRAHHPGAVPPARAVHIKLTGRRVVGHLQKLVCLLHAWVCFINYGDVNVTHSRSLNRRLLALP